MKKYSHTFPKRSPKMRRVSGRLQEVVCTRSFHLACEQAFRGALAAGQEKERSLQALLTFPAPPPERPMKASSQAKFNCNKLL